MIYFHYPRLWRQQHFSTAVDVLVWPGCQLFPISHHLGQAPGARFSTLGSATARPLAGRETEGRRKVWEFSFCSVLSPEDSFLPPWNSERTTPQAEGCIAQLAAHIPLAICPQKVVGSWRVRHCPAIRPCSGQGVRMRPNSFRIPPSQLTLKEA